MNGKAQRFFEGIKGRRVAVVGIGVSNTDLIKLLCEKGAAVTVHDRRAADAVGEVAAQLHAAGAKLMLGDNYLRGAGDCDILLRTPGMYYLDPKLTQLRADGVIVTSEMELFFDLCPCPIYAVTGSDGKTTTSTIISEMLRMQGFTVHLGGNIGRALLPQIGRVAPTDRAVVELSSFQLISMRCAPQVSVVTNVAPNHLDVHKDMQEYIDAKRNIFLHQNALSKTVLNLDNETTRSFIDQARGRVYCFSRTQKPRFGTYLADDGNLYLNTRAGEVCVMSRDDILLPGIHNVENYLAAASAVCDEVQPGTMRRVAQSFRGVEHRIEFVRELEGVKYYNDSIASSPTRTIAGLHSFPQKLILIAGGYDKKIPFLPLAPEINKHVKILILMGATAEKIEREVRAHPTYDAAALAVLHAQDMEQAVKLAQRHAQPGDIVTLSPACASFDKYPNFEARGRHYKEIVRSLE